MKYDPNELIEMLRQHEGSEYNDQGQLISYFDKVPKKGKPNGNLTVGYGHKVLEGDVDIYGKPIVSTNQIVSEEQALKWFEQDTRKAIRQASSIQGFDRMSANRQMAMIDLTFNMGFGWTTEFKKGFMLLKRAAELDDPIRSENLYRAAADELRFFDGRRKDLGPSKYSMQTKTRAVKISGLVEDG